MSDFTVKLPPKAIAESSQLKGENPSQNSSPKGSPKLGRRGGRASRGRKSDSSRSDSGSDGGSEYSVEESIHSLAGVTPSVAGSELSIEVSEDRYDAASDAAAFESLNISGHVEDEFDVVRDTSHWETFLPNPDDIVVRLRPDVPSTQVKEPDVDEEWDEEQHRLFEYYMAKSRSQEPVLAEDEVDLDLMANDLSFPEDPVLDLNSSAASWATRRESDHPFYYGSAQGILGMTPLFQKPVELLANCKRLVWSTKDQCVKGHGRHFYVPDFDDIRLNRLESLAVQAENLRHHIVGLAMGAEPEKHKSRVRAYLSRLRVLEYMRTTWDALLLSYQQIRLFDPQWAMRLTAAQRHALKKALKRWKRKILLRPHEAAKELKRIGGIARSLYFDEKQAAGLPVLLHGLTRDGCRLFSYIGRALPPPPDERAAEIKEYVARITSEPPPYDPDWCEFVDDYFARHIPKGEVNYRTDPSVSASLGYSREKGGFTKAVQDLVTFGCLIHTIAHRSNFDPSNTAPLTPEQQAAQRSIAALWQTHCSDMSPYPDLRDQYRTDVMEDVSDRIGQTGLCPLCPHLQELEVPAARRDLQAKATAAKGCRHQVSYDAYGRKRLFVPKQAREGPHGDQLAEGTTVENVFSVIESESIHSYYLNVAVRVQLGMIPAIPLCALYAEEKGLKARMPATTLAAATLVYQLLRRAIDSHLFQDPRFSEPMGGPIPLPKGKSMLTEPGKYYYSQDLSFATDLHPFWLERTAYEAVIDHHPKLKWTEQFFDKLFGPHAILTDPNKIPDPPKDTIRITEPWWVSHPNEPANADLWNAATRGWKIAGNRVLQSSFAPAYNYIADVLSWLDDVASLTEAYTTTSASMGDSTSFPIMPLLTAYAAHKAGTPHLWGAGDDAVIANCTDETVAIFESTITSCGAVLSKGDPKKGKPNKIFRHPRKFNFCEEMFELTDSRLKRKQFFHTSLWSAPPGGSKGHIDWFNQPASVLEHARRIGLRGKRGLWPYSKTAQHHRAAYALGLPIGQPVELGGVGHPSFPRNQRSISNPDWRTAWLNKLSQITVIDWALGNGLSPLPKGQTQESREISKAQMRLLQRLRLAETKEPVYTTDASVAGLTNLAIQDVADLVAGMVTSWEVYHRKPPREIVAPRILTALRSFQRKIFRVEQILTSPKLGRTLADVDQKKSIRVDARVKLINERDLAVRAYGLLPYVVPKADKAQFQWQRLARWKTEDAYLIPQERG